MCWLFSFLLLLFFHPSNFHKCLGISRLFLRVYAARAGPSLVMSHSAHLCSRLRPCLSGYRVETARSRGSVVEADASYGTQRQTKAPGPPRPATSTAQNESLDVVRFCSAEPRRAPAARSRLRVQENGGRPHIQWLGGGASPRLGEDPGRGLWRDPASAGSRALRALHRRGSPHPTLSGPLAARQLQCSGGDVCVWGGGGIVTENKQNRKARLQTRTFGVGLLPATHEGTGTREAPRLQGRGGRSTPSPAGLGRGREDAGAPAPPGPSLS